MKRPSRGSQCGRILAVLEDGQPHPMLEIHARVGTCRLNSRIAELRSRYGCHITCDAAAGRYVYQLLGAPLSGGGEPRRVASGEPHPSGAAWPHPAPSPPTLSGAPAQAGPGGTGPSRGQETAADADSPGQLTFLGGTTA